MVEKALWGRKVNLAVPTPETFPTDDEIDKMEALLPGCKHGWLESNDVALHYRKFEPTKKKSRAVVVFMHGISAQSGKGIVLQSSGRKLAMSLLSDELMKAGYTLYALDMRGHGYSEGTRFYVPTWETNRDDLDALVHLASNEHPDEPLFLMGESYGATLCLHLARKWQTMSGAPDKFSGLALIAPAIIGDVPPWPITYTLRYLLAPLAPKWTPFFMPNPVSADRIWSDKEVLENQTNPRYLSMGLTAGGLPFRLGTAVQLLTATEKVRSDAIPRLNVPYCAVHGTHDVAVPISGTDFLEEKAMTPAEDRVIHRIEGAYHDLLGEPCAEDTTKYLIAFMEDRLSNKSK